MLGSCLGSNLGGSRGLSSSLSVSSGGSLLALSGSGLLVVIILLAGGVDGDLDGDLAALDLLTVHLGTSLLLKLLGAQGDETEATALARLAASLELLDHEAGNGAESDLGGARGVVLEDVEELCYVSISFDADLITMHTLSSLRS
jgi:hypothetical protein